MATARSLVSDAFRATLDLFAMGLALKRQTLRRQAPDVSEHEIDRRLARWLRTRPGAESGDAHRQRTDVAEPQ